MERFYKMQLLASLESDQADVCHKAALRLAAIGEPAAWPTLKKRIRHPVRVNGPDHEYFEQAMAAVECFLEAFAGRLSLDELDELSELEDLFQDVIYYLEDDPNYDVGHDFIHADYSRIRSLARAELDKRCSVKSR